MQRTYTFIPMLQAIWDRLSELSTVETKTETERFEEQALTRKFFEIRPINDRIRDKGILGYDPNGLTDIQARIMRLARYQKLEG